MLKKKRSSFTHSVDFGTMTFGMNCAAIDWVHAILIGLTPEKIALTREAFSHYRYPLTDFTPKDIAVYLDRLAMQPSEVFDHCGRKFKLPHGWGQGFATDVSDSVGVPA